ncbi:MAG: hypothetical protein ACLFUW_00470 [Bacteroidales bacterium]
MRILIAISFVLFSIAVYPQKTVMFQETEDLYKESNFGANSKHFVHFYGGISFFLPTNGGEGIKYWNTHSLVCGARYKLKLTNVFSNGIDLHYKKVNYRFTNDNAILPGEGVYDKERFVVHGIGPEYYLRINFDKDRGEYIGNFIDLGIYADWLFHDTYKVYDDDCDSFSYSKCKKTYTNHSRLNKFAYGITIRMAKNSFVLFLNHRLSNYFDDDYGYLALPKTNMGIIFGFHN